MASLDEISRLLRHTIESRHQVSTDLHREDRSIDDAEIGEFAYDYVELTREVLNDVEVDAVEREFAASRFSGDAPSTRPFDHKHSIPLANMGTYPGRSSVPRS